MTSVHGQKGKKNDRVGNTCADACTADLDCLFTGRNTDRYQTFAVGNRETGRKGRKMISREDQTWTNVMNNGSTELFEIAISLGRIADMLTEMNGYHVEYGEKQRAEEAHDVMPIIRCKDCKFATITDGVYGREPEVKYCDIWFPNEAEYMPTNYYCPLAERKDNG